MSRTGLLDHWSRSSHIERYAAISRDRALTDAESLALGRLLHCDNEFQRRVPARVARLRAELHQLEARLLPHQLAELARIEAELAADRADRIERELAAHFAREETAND